MKYKILKPINEENKLLIEVVKIRGKTRVFCNNPDCKHNLTKTSYIKTTLLMLHHITPFFNKEEKPFDYWGNHLVRSFCCIDCMNNYFSNNLYFILSLQHRFKDFILKFTEEEAEAIKLNMVVHAI